MKIATFMISTRYGRAVALYGSNRRFIDLKAGLWSVPAEVCETWVFYVLESMEKHG